MSQRSGTAGSQDDSHTQPGQRLRSTSPTQPSASEPDKSDVPTTAQKPMAQSQEARSDDDPTNDNQHDSTVCKETKNDAGNSRDSASTMSSVDRDIVLQKQDDDHEHYLRSRSVSSTGRRNSREPTTALKKSVTVTTDAVARNPIVGQEKLGQATPLGRTPKHSPDPSQASSGSPPNTRSPVVIEIPSESESDETRNALVGPQPGVQPSTLGHLPSLSPLSTRRSSSPPLASPTSPSRPLIHITTDNNSKEPPQNGSEAIVNQQDHGGEEQEQGGEEQERGGEEIPVALTSLAAPTPLKRGPGRPRKVVTTEATTLDELGSPVQPERRPRGRPRSNKVTASIGGEATSVEAQHGESQGAAVLALPIRRKRGRPSRKDIEQRQQLQQQIQQQLQQQQRQQESVTQSSTELSRLGTIDAGETLDRHPPPQQQQEPHPTDSSIGIDLARPKRGRPRKHPLPPMQPLSSAKPRVTQGRPTVSRNNAADSESLSEVGQSDGEEAPRANVAESEEVGEEEGDAAIKKRPRLTDSTPESPKLTGLPGRRTLSDRKRESEDENNSNSGGSPIRSAWPGMTPEEGLALWSEPRRYSESEFSGVRTPSPAHDSDPSALQDTGFRVGEEGSPEMDRPYSPPSRHLPVTNKVDRVDDTHLTDDLRRLHRLYRQHGYWNAETNRPQRPRQWSRMFVFGTALPFPTK
ncbi:hypothetical protein DFQ26_002472 [Actinomortierella ambigua]|nr:hypothetical protein DFQ26_002472 [Actinomortierella ambigua]